MLKRKDLIRDAGLVIPGAIALTMIGAKFAFADDGDFDGPLDVLNYALTLEYLEAEFYRQGNEVGLLDGKAADYLATIQTDEETHVMTLQDTIASLGGTPVPAPQVDFGESFATADSYLETAYTFENLGVQAYLGAAPSLFQEKELLTAAASIFGVEARHAAIIGVLQEKPAEGGVYQGAFETPLARAEVLQAASPFIVSAETL
ncbi:twin-arginine translocation pathway signal [Beutenbergia cavernae DSM 12333]|uniref:Twin-arginine translocation pathway signal n=1 Tax=Beutenbergia cavernae (strain ATCC BAA-8 / DSM 12333 / CCUG 43141 / JCM 11478 / NBRC 16432 / NCIMB 13614 / HKI 0122) TaxID=471853 RepID=C5C2C1_BEUC1|nr:ferritin-like domain-containing protein [Beutenbergia cavernae]ACQ81746.1 twin-arginine translocation pathway signal [Beutenbergia cavernae DSM 12333]